MPEQHHHTSPLTSASVFVGIEDLQARYRRGRSTIYELVRQAGFPGEVEVWVMRVEVGPKTTVAGLLVERWTAEHSQDWIDAARDSLSAARVEELGVALAGMRGTAQRREKGSGLRWMARTENPLEDVSYSRSSTIEGARPAVGDELDVLAVDGDRLLSCRPRRTRTSRPRSCWTCWVSRVRPYRSSWSWSTGA